MNTRIRIIVSAVLALTGIERSAECQMASQDSSTVLAAAIESVRSYAPQGATRFGFEDTLRISESKGVQIARMLGHQYGSLKTERVCSRPGPAYCHLVGPKVFIQVTQVDIRSERAEVLLTVLDETKSHRQPIHYAYFRVLLARSGSSWRLTEVKPLAET